MLPKNPGGSPGRGAGAAPGPSDGAGSTPCIPSIPQDANFGCQTPPRLSPKRVLGAPVASPPQVLYIQAFVLVFLLGKFMGKVFFGQLRAAEMEVSVGSAAAGPARGARGHFGPQKVSGAVLGGILDPKKLPAPFRGGNLICLVPLLEGSLNPKGCLMPVLRPPSLWGLF